MPDRPLSLVLRVFVSSPGDVADALWWAAGLGKDGRPKPGANVTSAAPAAPSADPDLRG